MTARIRMASAADAEALAGLMAELGYAHTAEGIRDLQAEIVARGGAVIVAEGEGRLLGCVSALLDVRLAEGRCGEVASLVVAEAYRGQGLGAELVAAAEAWLGPLVDRVRVRAHVGRREAHAFYCRRGYREVKDQRLFARSTPA
ncbi:GNAT family N-acetyltransferase [Halomonas koreensis]|uniref:GNAT family N-acetyltransferase n=1 Tax=Halomonas koreensis TaxID=245385 RepID=A0ABU1G5M1_9GAMM|nr:GNAT family N-acetyltransferase [Halomonas koreensis]MDR5868224.1 GNAT family N-acetyltransferase [Halomonas koreensis]